MPGRGSPSHDSDATPIRCRHDSPDVLKRAATLRAAAHGQCRACRCGLEAPARRRRSSMIAVCDASTVSGISASKDADELPRYFRRRQRLHIALSPAGPARRYDDRIFANIGYSFDDAPRRHLQPLMPAAAEQARRSALPGQDATRSRQLQQPAHSITPFRRKTAYDAISRLLAAVITPAYRRHSAASSMPAVVGVSAIMGEAAQPTRR